MFFGTVRVGTGLRSSRDFFHAFKASGIILRDWAKHIIRSPDFPVAEEERSISLASVSVADLKLRERSVGAVIYPRAENFGLKKLPLEAGPQIALQLSQRMDYNVSYIIGMESVVVPDGYPVAFRVDYRKTDDNEATLNLRTTYVHLHSSWPPETRWLFEAPPR